MDRPFLRLFIFFVAFAAAVSHGATPGQLYWDSVLPNTPMPSAIKDLLAPVKEDKVSVDIGKGDVHADTGEGKPGGTKVDVGRKGVGVVVGGEGHGSVHVGTGKGMYGGSAADISQKGVSVNVGGPGKPRVGVNTGKHHVPVYVTVPPYGGPFYYRYSASETQVHDDPSVALFFLEKDLHPGAKMTFSFPKPVSHASFLPRGESSSIPFSSAKLPEILSRFDLDSNSIDAALMKKTLQECEEPAIDGESKHCATSLESMVDFSIASLGTQNIRAASTAVENKVAPKQQYMITRSGPRPIPGPKLVACHEEAYAYAVFYCHTTTKTKAYRVPMVGEDGTKVEAVAVCHADTSAWNPEHLAFKVLKVKPGSVAVCHFLPPEHIVWGLEK